MFDNERKEKLLNLAVSLESSRLRVWAMSYPGDPSKSQEPDNDPGFVRECSISHAYRANT